MVQHPYCTRIQLYLYQIDCTLWSAIDTILQHHNLIPYSWEMNIGAPRGDPFSKTSSRYNIEVLIVLGAETQCNFLVFSISWSCANPQLHCSSFDMSFYTFPKKHHFKIHIFIKNSCYKSSIHNPVARPPISMIPCIYGLRLESICDIFVSTSRFDPHPLPDPSQPPPPLAEHFGCWICPQLLIFITKNQ